MLSSLFGLTTFYLHTSLMICVVIFSSIYIILQQVRQMFKLSLASIHFPWDLLYPNSASFQPWSGPGSSQNHPNTRDVFSTEWADANGTVRQPGSITENAAMFVIFCSGGRDQQLGHAKLRYERLSPSRHRPFEQKAGWLAQQYLLISSVVGAENRRQWTKL